MYHYHTLNNGIRIVFRKNNSVVTHSGIYINIGSRDENGSDEGLAHFIEHTIFKGTEHRKAHHIQQRIDGVGGELNAFTTKEETCVYATALSSHLERCLELFADIIFHSTFPDSEIEKEKDVVIEEINSYIDTPSEQIFDDFEENIFAGHPLAHNILGTKKNVRRFNSNRIKEFMHNNYTTDRMVITIVGNSGSTEETPEREFRKIVRLCKKYFDHYPQRLSAASRSSKPTCNLFNKTIKCSTHQAHILVGCKAPNVYDKEKAAFSLLNNIIGGPAMNSRLNVAIRERYGICYTIESQYTPFSDIGLFSIYAGIDFGSKERFFSMLEQCIRWFSNNNLTDAALRSAQRQYIAQTAIANEYALNEMQSIGKSLLAFDRVDTLSDMQRDIESVTANDIRDIAQRFLNFDNFCTLIYC